MLIELREILMLLLKAFLYWPAPVLSNLCAEIRGQYPASNSFYQEMILASIPENPPKHW